MEVSDEVIVNSSRLKSEVWNDFDRVKKGETYVAICRHCKKKLSGSSTSGTSHLRNHLIRCRRRSNHDISQLLSAKGKKKEETLALANVNFDQEQRKSEKLNFVRTRYELEQIPDGAINMGHGNFDNKRSRFDLARMIIVHGYPLTMVEHVGFQLFTRNLQPLFELVTVNRVEADCIEIYQREKQKVYEVLDKLHGKISLSADMWTDKEDAHYLSLTAHFVDDDWQLKKKILNFIKIDLYHAEDMLSEIIMTSLMDWDIDRKLFSMTSDSNSASDNIVSRIRDRLSQNRFLLCNGQLFDVRCAANIVRLMSQDALKAISDVTHKIRESIRYARSSLPTQEKFNEMVHLVRVDSRKSLSLDNPMRWDSTYFMLEVALEYKHVFSLLHEHDSAYTTCPSDVEWDRASAITGYLKFFVEVCNVFTGNKHPTPNIYFPEICDVHLQLIEWSQNSDAYISSLALKMKSKFDEYWKKCSLALAVAAILDPRFKMKLVEYYYPQIYGASASDSIDIVSNCMKALYNGHAICSPLDAQGQGLACEVGGSGGVNNESRDRLTGFDRFLHETSQSQNTKSDLDKYLEEPLFPRNSDFNILNWWKVHTPRYPILSMMARNVLGIQMSKVSFESAFCNGDQTLDHDRSSLRSDTVQALVCAQDWMQNDPDDPRPTSSHSPLSISYDVN
ncbi:zinc finger BED domain-containing protein RICESLEEPER 1-like [Diospyros lotus]|uniref:zinc finger BED domain-containing protein RICESLEEPER 1-like n=1 Tax=Diospyros lotus TaxID=55363 RepID=UPI00224DB135|nr:zinc finger BED domain-containing protein RICESLEEPER 1-like [Diospyros lotus]XP_052178604.1 zinc finger BED domain-containing protein RICESLEEPER 1-like [Diospyros lotus]XP_052178605.1 zinc finger BED domain-containing protein RICESLEEPER 1-like [Diospyros lotus]XP_052178606.1 zinc finger BED domain-containing protein RICESLEEPER 1-like [Diospyros lotus]XP_052178607.1 zinc finger BED domain-containing protein RICESLEEPER 1-like [Diospyros lotus]XP_052178608.1 zinc finger BED domain-contain